MFEITMNDINEIRRDYGICSKAISFTELERYHYERNDPKSKEVRLIVKVELSDDGPIVIRFKNETDVSLELIEKQSQFAALLGENGIEPPALYKTGSHYAKWYSINGYDVIVTVERFVKGEISCVDTDTARETGRLLAKTHNIAENANFHVENDILFDPFVDNDLFVFSGFKEHESDLLAVDAALYEGIVEKYDTYMQKLASIQKEPKYAVQGDISNCNLYRTSQGKIGIFDFNRCGDNHLYCDAVMQAVFEARLMDYPASYAENHEMWILPAFLQGYQLERPFSNTQREMYPYLYAIINAFWSADIKWNENSLMNELAKGNMQSVRKWLNEIYRRIHFLPPMIL